MAQKVRRSVRHPTSSRSTFRRRGRPSRALAIRSLPSCPCGRWQRSGESRSRWRPSCWGLSDAGVAIAAPLIDGDCADARWRVGRQSC